MKIAISDIRITKKAKVVLKKLDCLKIKNPYLVTPKKVVQFMEKAFAISSKAEEFFYLICLSRKGKVLTAFEVSHGTVNKSVVGMSELMIRVLLSGAPAIIVVHNHPSGIPAPSKEDINVTQKIRETCNLIGISFFDHIIVASGDYYSFAKVKNACYYKKG